MIGNELPKGWILADFLDAVEIFDNLRKPINSKERQRRIAGKDTKNLFPYYGATGQVGYIDDFLSDGEYVLLGEDGAPFLDTTANKAYLISGKAWVNNHAHVLRSKTSNKFLCYYLNQFNYKDYVSGTTRYKLTQEKMKRIPVLLPPLAEQHRIVAKIEELFLELDRGIAGLEKAKAQLKTYRQAVLNSSFMGNLTESWRSIHSEDVLDNYLAQLEYDRKLAGNKKNYVLTGDIWLDPLPENWKWVCIGDISSGVEYGSSKKSETSGRIPVLRMGNIQSYYFDWTDLVFSSDEDEIKKYALSKDDVLFNRTNSPELVGKTALYNGEYPAIFAGYLIRLNQLKSINAKYLNYYLNSPIARKYGNKVKTDGVNQSNINGNKLCHYPFPLCSELEQNEVVSEIEFRFSLCDSLEKTIDSSLKNAETLRLSILKKAFAGELLKQDPAETSSPTLSKENT